MNPREAMSHRLRIALAVLALVMFGARAAAGQQTGGDSMQAHVSGWSVTPAIVFAGNWDDNVLMHVDADTTRGDYLSVVNPRGTLEYNGRRQQFSLYYDGAFLLYRDLGTLNSYDQHAFLSQQWRLSRRVSLFVRDTAAVVPTTDAIEFVGVPFLRVGTKVNELRGGAEVVLTKRTGMTVGYTSTWIAFDDKNAAFQLLQGGHAHGAIAALKHQLGSRLFAVANYDFQHATVTDTGDPFDVSNAIAALEYRLTDLTTISGGAGISHLTIPTLGLSKTGPALQAGLTRQFRKAGLDVAYRRSFLPSYGIGGTMQNEEVVSHGRLPLNRRVYLQASLAWRRTDALFGEQPKLNSWWYAGGIGYGLTPWMRLEGVYNGSRQTIDRPGGMLHRNQIGFQVVMAQPVRIH